MNNFKKSLGEITGEEDLFIAFMDLKEAYVSGEEEVGVQ